ncbi:MAG: BrxE family protein [Deltaproteobacteria bacterium]|nr:BrxE family protein [Deltaproteobacteria bacterium]
MTQKGWLAIVQEHGERGAVVCLAQLVAQAGSSQHLKWWDDEALTAAGHYALERIFPRNPRFVAMRLALRSARERHAGVLAGVGAANAITLFDAAEALLDAGGCDDHDLSRDFSVDEFRSRLRATAANAQVAEPDSRGVIDAGAFGTDWLARAAAAYLRGEAGRPVFPFFRTPQSRGPA